MSYYVNLFRSSPLTLFAQIVILASVVAMYGCGAQKIARKSPTPNGSLLADVKGIDEEDKKLAGIRYLLVCDKLEAIQGQIVADQEKKDVVSFSSDKLIDGLSCALEVRADEKEGVTWLSDPETKGLYYGSDKAAIKDKRLSVKLYKVYASKGEELSALAVHTDDAGLCQKFDIETRTCKDGTPETPPTDAAVNDAGFATTVDASSRNLKVSSIKSGSLAEKAGLAVGDEILLLNGETPPSGIEMNVRLSSLMANSSDGIWLNVVTSGQNRIVWLVEKS